MRNEVNAKLAVSVLLIRYSSGRGLVWFSDSGARWDLPGPSVRHDRAVSGPPVARQRRYRLQNHAVHAAAYHICTEYSCTRLQMPLSSILAVDHSPPGFPCCIYGAVLVCGRVSARVQPTVPLYLKSIRSAAFDAPKYLLALILMFPVHTKFMLPHSHAHVFICSICELFDSYRCSCSPLPR